MRIFITVTAILAFISGTSAFAEEKPWKESAELSVVSTNGNSRGTVASAKNTFTYNWTKTHLEIIGGALSNESQNQITAEQYNASEKAIRDLTAKNYVFEKYGWDKNRFAGILQRHDFSAGLGRILLDLTDHALTLELGAGYTNEERAQAPRHEFSSGLIHSKYIWTITATSNFSQTGEFSGNLKDADDYRLKTETALTAAISTHVSLKTAYTWKRQGKPVQGFTKDDTVTSLALLVNY